MGRLTKQYSSDYNKSRIVIERDYHYDVLGQLTHLSGQTQLSSQVKKPTSNVSTATSSFKRNHQYQYDKVGRLTEHKLTDYTQQRGTTERFAFDPASNRVPVSTLSDKANDDIAQEKNSIHKSGRPTKLITADKLITYTYGIHGQVLFKTLTPAKDGKAIPQSTHALVSSRKSIQHYYNPNNELVKTITNTEEGFTLTEVTATYYYDAFGRRIAKASDTKVKTKFINSKHLKTVKNHIQQQKTKQQTTLMLWDGNRQAQEYTDTHVFTTVYEQDSFEPVARLVWLKDGLTLAANDEGWYGNNKPAPPDAIQIYHYHNDHLGTPNELTSQKGEVIWLADYQAWGNTAKVVWREEKLEQLQVAKEDLQPLRFQGQYYDEETGLHYNRFRYFDPDLGMFISRDPIGLMGGSNTFAYAPNPTGWVDPLGLSCIQWVSPFDLNFSQGYVTDPQYSEILSDMQKNGWDVNKSVLEVAIIDGQKVSLDNRRLLAAQNANLSQVPIRIVDLDAPRPDGGTYGSNLSKKLKSRPPRRRDLNPIDVGHQGTPNKPQVVSSKKPCP